MVSKLHIRLGEVLHNSTVFNQFKIYEEYPVKKINPDYPTSRHRFDWVVMDIFLVIECHGEQHYRPIQFGGLDNVTSIDSFYSQRIRDRDKMQAALDAGFTYIEIAYNENITEDLIWEKYQNCLNPRRLKSTKKNKQNKDFLNKTKEIRSKLNKQYYQLIKQRKRLVNEND